MSNKNKTENGEERRYVFSEETRKMQDVEQPYRDRIAASDERNSPRAAERRHLEGAARAERNELRAPENHQDRAIAQVRGNIQRVVGNVKRLEKEAARRKEYYPSLGEEITRDTIDEERNRAAKKIWEKLRPELNALRNRDGR